MPKDPTGLEPTCMAFVLCEYAHRDARTGRYTLLGTVNNIEGAFFPGESPEIFVYVALTDGRGSQRVSIQLIDVDDAEDEPMHESSSLVSFKTPETIVEIAFRIPPMRFARPDIFRLQLLANDAIIAERSYVVKQDDDHET